MRDLRAANGRVSMAKVQAELRGDTMYFTGKPCKHGHYAPRNVLSGKCVTCQRLHSQSRPRITDRRWGTVKKDPRREGRKTMEITIVGLITTVIELRKRLEQYEGSIGTDKFSQIDRGDRGQEILPTGESVPQRTPDATSSGGQSMHGVRRSDSGTDEGHADIRDRLLTRKASRLRSRVRKVLQPSPETSQPTYADFYER